MYKTSYGDLVSVIVPSFNHEQFVAKALESLFAQTYPHIELIVIDDKSTDNTLLVAADWACQPAIRQRFKRLKLLKNERNIGAHATINRGIAEAQGMVITILNSDDVFLPNRVERLVIEMEESGSGFAFSKVIPIDEKDTPIPDISLPQHLREVFYLADRALHIYPSISFGFLVANLTISTGNMFIHKALIEKIGGFRPFLYVHDWDFALRAILETEPAYIAEPLYGYRIHSANSFLSLKGVKDIECDAVMDHFSNLLCYRPVNNKQAPTPQNWPYVFELFVSQLYLLRWNDFARQQEKKLEQMTQFRIYDLEQGGGIMLSRRQDW